MAAPTPFGRIRDWLPDYLLAVRRLLHDPSYSYFQDQQLSDYIAAARDRVCVATGALRQIVEISLSQGQGSFAIGSVLSIGAGIAAPSGASPQGGTWTAPFSLVTGTGGTATCSTAQVPASFTVGAGGLYYAPPLVSLDPGMAGSNTSVFAKALLAADPAAAGAAQAVSSILATQDLGQWNANGVTPAVYLTAQGSPAALTVSGGDLALGAGGSGFDVGCVLADAKGNYEDFGAANASILSPRIASVDQMAVHWGGYRVPLRNFAYTDFKIETGSLINYQQVPYAFSVVGRTIYVGPTPSQALTYGLDCTLYPKPLATLQQVGELEDRSETAAVPLYAGYLAKLDQQDAQGANELLELFNLQVHDAVSRFTTRLSEPYPGDDNLDW